MMILYMLALIQHFALPTATAADELLTSAYARLALSSLAPDSGCSHPRLDWLERVIPVPDRLDLF